VSGLSHLDANGAVHMVDVGGKPVIGRSAVAEGYFAAAEPTLDLLLSGALPKGEALAAARLAGILAAKRCDELIPLCHTLPLDRAAVRFERVAPDRLRIVGEAATSARTGVEMEALVAVALAALTLYDMCKGVDRTLRIEGIGLLEKRKGGAASPMPSDSGEIPS